MLKLILFITLSLSLEFVKAQTESSFNVKGSTADEVIRTNTAYEGYTVKQLISIMRNEEVISSFKVEIVEELGEQGYFDFVVDVEKEIIEKGSFDFSIHKEPKLLALIQLLKRDIEEIFTDTAVEALRRQGYDSSNYSALSAAHLLNEGKIHILDSKQYKSTVDTKKSEVPYELIDNTVIGVGALQFITAGGLYLADSFTAGAVGLGVSGLALMAYGFSCRKNF